MEKTNMKDSISISEQKNITIKFLAMEGVHKRLKALGHFASKQKPSPLTLNVGGKSYTDGKRIVVSLPVEAMEYAFNNARKTTNFGIVNFNKTFEIIYLFIETLYFHEIYHQLCSNFKEFKKYNEEEAQILKEAGVSEMFADYIVHSIGNIIEDGRIENIAGIKMPGSVRKFQFLRYFFWSQNRIKGTESQLQAVIEAILSLSSLGVYPSTYGRFFSNSPADREIDKIKHLINEGITSKTCKEGLDKSREILKSMQSFILSEYAIISKEEEIMDELMELLEEIVESSDFVSSDEVIKSTSNNTKSTIHNELSEKTDKESEVNDSDKWSEQTRNETVGNEKIIEKDSKLNKESEMEEKNPQKKYSKQKEKSQSKEMQLKEADPEEMTSSTQGENSSGSDVGEDSIEKIDDLTGAKISDTNIKNTSEEDFVAEGEYPLSSGFDESSSNQDISPGYFDHELAEWMEKITKDRSQNLSDILSEFYKAGDMSIKDEKRKTQSDDSQKWTERPYGFKEFPNNFSLKSSLPPLAKVKADKLKKEIEEIFKNKQSLSLKHQQKGILNTNDIYKVALKDYNIFNTRGSKDLSDYVVYILLDGSGSMSGGKEVQQAYAASIIEYALKDILPFKITVFTSSRGIEHHIVKDWDDKSNQSYSYNFLQHRRASGENDDGISIKIASEELLKRQEKDKILIVLSDGLPSSLEDTKNAVREAKDKGIYVTGIIFGDEEFRKKNFHKVLYMYETNVISVEPDIIPDKLAVILKQIISR